VQGRSAILLCAGFLAANFADAEPLVIGSKNFTENYILAEAAAQLLESHGIEVERRQLSASALRLWRRSSAPVGSETLS
jgi:glycine betaine/choline ABC-type transport system substrate-binding protein